MAEVRFQAADAVAWLDLPRFTCLFRVTVRELRGSPTPLVDSWRWIWRYPRHGRLETEVASEAFSWSTPFSGSDPPTWPRFWLESSPDRGMPVRRRGETVQRARLLSEGGVVGPKRNGELCVSTVADDPLEAVRITITDRGE